MRVLVTGWFSFLHGEATAGDLLAKDVATRWLDQAEVAYDTACSPVLGGGVNWEHADPEQYTDVLFVCGPTPGAQLTALRERYPGARLSLLDVSMDTFDDDRADLIFERDSDRLVRPDLAIAAGTPPAPFVPVVRGHAQPEYGSQDGNDRAHAIIDAFLARHRLATIDVDTRVDPDNPGACEPAQIEGRLARADVVVTSRLHGMVLAIKHGVPALAIDPVYGGGKVSAQAQALEWPEVITLDRASDEAVDAAFDRCLEQSARELAERCRRNAQSRVNELGKEFIQALTRTPARQVS